ncbi:hypothetical protein SAMN05660659_02767 [Pseudomonas sp. LAMO17WK12:I6]|nr:hypothetical protein SAMN05660659_02767 [Pseudomonas sp. LAMO17WK12:I6]SNY29441.1 hypothetical protein SAMN05660455_03260 [Pseudomonas sp. LAMO17WK12:I5]
MLYTPIAALNRVRMISHRLPRYLVNHLHPIIEMHWHRQQSTKRRPSTTLSNNHRARTTDHDIAVPIGAVERGGVQAIDEYSPGNSAGDRAATG